MAMALELCFGIPAVRGYLMSALVVIPLVTHGITIISRLQLWTQPLWIVLQIVPFVSIAFSDLVVRGVDRIHREKARDGGFDLLLFGAAA